MAAPPLGSACSFYAGVAHPFPGCVPWVLFMQPPLLQIIKSQLRKYICSNCKISTSKVYFCLGGALGKFKGLLRSSVAPCTLVALTNRNQGIQGMTRFGRGGGGRETWAAARQRSHFWPSWRVWAPGTKGLSWSPPRYWPSKKNQPAQDPNRETGTGCRDRYRMPDRWLFIVV